MYKTQQFRTQQKYKQPPQFQRPHYNERSMQYPASKSRSPHGRFNEFEEYEGPQYDKRVVKQITDEATERMMAYQREHEQKIADLQEAYNR